METASTMGELKEKFARGIYVQRDQLIKKLMDLGYEPEEVAIKEKISYDEVTLIASYECWPVLVEPPAKTDNG